MEQQQIAKLMTIISNNYQNQLNKLDGKGYYDNLSMFLKDKEYTLVAKNLYDHITSSNFLPTIADLVKQPVSEYRIPVPNYEETKQRMLLLETKVDPVDADFMDKIKRDMQQKIEEGRKKHEQRVTKLFEQ